MYDDEKPLIAVVHHPNTVEAAIASARTTHEDSDETRAAQDAFINAVGITAMVQ
jgi:hypothetical protein